MTLRISLDSRGYYVQERFFCFWRMPTSDAGAFTTLGWDCRRYKYFNTLEEADAAIMDFMDFKKSVKTKPTPLYKYTINKGGYRIEKC